MLAIIDEWNAAQPISQLPPEVIAHVVGIGIPITEYFGGKRGRSTRDYMKTLAALATISRTWRNTIVGTPSLWGLLSTNLPLHINSMSLERSGNCPLLVDARDPETTLSTIEVLELALPYWNRWSHVYLGRSPGERIVGYLSSAAPSLEVVHVEVNNWNRLTKINLFGGCAPRLREIAVTYGKLMWDPESFRGLRKVTLRDAGEHFSSPDNILALLAANPLLELLNIEGAVNEPQPPLRPLSTRPPVHLPNLKDILFGYLCIEAVASILALIRVPNCQSLCLSDLHNSTSADSFDEPARLSQSLGQFDDFLRSSLTLHRSSKLFFQEQSTRWVCRGESERQYDPGFWLDMPWGDLRSGVLWALQLLGPAPEPSHRIEVTIWVEEVDGEAVPGLKALSYFSNVWKLEVLPQPHSVIMDLLASANETTGTPAFPGLEELELPMPYHLPHALQSLEVALKRRYSEPRRGIAAARPMKIIFTEQFYRPESSPLERRPRSDQLCKIRALQGVESVTLMG